MAEPLRLVSDDGEVNPEGPATMAEALSYIDQLTDEVAGLKTEKASWRTKFQNLKRDKDKEARKDEVWPKALAVFRYWQEQTGHKKARFTADRFYLLAPFVRQDDGPALCRRAIRGRVSSDFHMRRGAYAGRDGAVHDKLEQIFASQGHFEAAVEMDRERDATDSQLSMIAAAGEICDRVLERVELIEDREDPVALAHLLIEINRLNLEWHAVPNRGDDADA